MTPPTERALIISNSIQDRLLGVVADMQHDITLGISEAVAEERRAWEAKKTEEVVLPGGVRFFPKKENPSTYILPWAVWIESTSLVHYPIQARIKGGLAEDQAKFLADILNKILGIFLSQ